MIWKIAPRMRCDIQAFSGLNFSGRRSLVEIHPVGGRQGAEIEPGDLGSVGIVADPGTRVLLRTSELDDGWEERPWRCILVDEKHCYRLKDGRTAVRVPDLDWLDEPDARRCDPDFQASFLPVDTLEEGMASGEWTFGRPGTLRGRVRVIVVDRVDRPYQD